MLTSKEHEIDPALAEPLECLAAISGGYRRVAEQFQFLLEQVDVE